MNYPENHLPELLAPAGSFEHMKAAVQAGADAVYFGGSRYGARAYAENFTTERVLEALDYLHLHGRRAYMTVNTLIKERELQEDLYEYLLPFYEAGLDGVIVQDLGAASFIRAHFPEMEIHGSTQMMITSVSGALAAGKLGMNRIVPARELSAREMKLIKEESGLELEVFIHGALCYCYSGQCLFSSTYGGRSGNRGRCAQPCRLPYRAYDASGDSYSRQWKHLLSPKDLCTLHELPAIIELGADSLKIEGRMKNVEFVAGVTSIYRKYLDLYASGEPYQVEEEDINILEELYSRGGFTEGYWFQHNGSGMMSPDVPRNLGRKIGKVARIFKGKVSLLLDASVNPKDVLIIPGEGEEEIVLTIPKESDQLSNPNGSYEITLKAPSTKSIKPGQKVYRRHNEKLNTRIQEEILNKKISYPVTGSLEVSGNQPVILRLDCRDISVCLEGPEPNPAEKRPIREEDLLRQMRKTGNVPYSLEDLRISLEPGLFLPASAIKELRQKAYEELTRAWLRTWYREKPVHAAGVEKRKSKTWTKERKMDIIATVYQEETLSYCLTKDLFDSILLPMDFYDKKQLIHLKKRIQEAGKKACLSLPRVFRQTTVNHMGTYLEDTIKDGFCWDAIYLNNINQIGILPDNMADISLVYSSSFYQWNADSYQVISNLNDAVQEELIYRELPLELSGKECLELLKGSSEMRGECMVYGRFPVMLSAQCVKKTLGRCNGIGEIIQLEDRRGRHLPISSHCHPDWVDPCVVRDSGDGLTCYNMIWSDSPRDLIGKEFHQISEYICRLRLDFFASSQKEIDDVVRRFFRWEKDSFLRQSGENTKDGTWDQGIE